MATREDFRIDKCSDCLRITRTDIGGDKHTHVASRKLANTIISNVCSEKIPLHSHSRTLESMMRLSDNEQYIEEISKLLSTRKQKGTKPPYVNAGVKKFFNAL